MRWELRKACEKLGIPYGTLSDWRKTVNRAKLTKEVTKENFILLEEEKRRLEQEVRELKRANSTLKEAMFFSRSPKEMTKGAIFDFIDEYSKATKMPVSNLCKTLGVIERSFYKHKKKVVKQSNLHLILCKIYEILDERQENKNYGVQRMRIALKDKDIDISISTVRTAMRLGNLIHESRRLQNGTTKADINTEKTKNLIKRMESWFATLKKEKLYQLDTTKLTRCFWDVKRKLQIK